MNDYSDYGGYGGYGDGYRSGFGGYGNGASAGGRTDGGGRGFGTYARDGEYTRGTNGYADYGNGAENNGGRNAYGAYGDVPPDMQSRMEQYSSMSRDELSDELMREASALRAQGMLDIGKLEEFCRMAAPYMSADQIRRMREIIDMLR